jgi:hypothetical protein
MNGLKLVMLSAVAGCSMLAIAPKAMAQAQGQVPLTQERPALPQAQVSIDTGVAPDCPYGYYEAAPNACAPYGYYGPEWFTGGAFVGAGPWFHGASDFHGQVDSRMNVENGYKGKLPERGEKADPSYHLDKNTDFKGNETRDGRGHKGPDPKDGDKK